MVKNKKLLILTVTTVSHKPSMSIAAQAIPGSNESDKNAW